MRKTHTFKHKILLIQGIILALIIVFQGVHQFQFEESLNKTEINDATDGDEDEERATFIDINQEYIATSILDSPHFESFEIMEIILPNDEESAFQIDEFVDKGTLFKVLFQQVISPNAP